MLTKIICDVIENAKSRALATVGEAGVNCVAVSVVTVSEGKIFLYDFFMDKSVVNITTTPEVALACWSGMEGVQVKAKANYYTKGTLFESAQTAMKEQFPDRTLKGVIELAPTAVFDISPGKTAQLS